jgi:hypothetical protein
VIPLPVALCAVRRVLANFSWRNPEIEGGSVSDRIVGGVLSRTAGGSGHGSFSLKGALIRPGKVEAINLRIVDLPGPFRRGPEVHQELRVHLGPSIGIHLGRGKIGSRGRGPPVVLLDHVHEGAALLGQIDVHAQLAGSVGRFDRECRETAYDGDCMATAYFRRHRGPRIWDSLRNLCHECPIKPPDLFSFTERWRRILMIPSAMK